MHQASHLTVCRSDLKAESGELQMFAGVLGLVISFKKKKPFSVMYLERATRSPALDGNLRG